VIEPKLILGCVKERAAIPLFLAVIALVSSCTTTSTERGAATTHLTYSKTVNQTDEDSPIHLYLGNYWKAVSKIESHDDLQYKQTLSTSGLLGEERLGFRVGMIEIGYSISKAGVMKIEGVRAPEHIPKNQVTLAKSAMQKAARSLKPPPDSVTLNDENEVRDTMVFDYR